MPFHRSLFASSFRAASRTTTTTTASTATASQSALLLLRPSATATSARSFSMAMDAAVATWNDDTNLSPARAKLRAVLEEYRQNKYVHLFSSCLLLGVYFLANVLFAFSHTLRFAFCAPLSHSFSQTLFSRFVKEMIHATDANHDGKISRTELCKLLDNIGAQGAMEQDEISDIFDELGTVDAQEKQKLIYNETVEDLILHQGSNATIMH